MLRRAALLRSTRIKTPRACALRGFCLVSGLTTLVAQRIPQTQCLCGFSEILGCLPKTGCSGSTGDAWAADIGPSRSLLSLHEVITTRIPVAWCGTRPTAHSAPRLSSALRAPPLCRCAERTADLILRPDRRAGVGALSTERQRPSVAAGAARRERFLGRRGAQPEGRCAKRTSLSFWPRLSERSARRARSEFCGPTLG